MTYLGKRESTTSGGNPHRPSWPLTKEVASASGAPDWLRAELGKTRCGLEFARLNLGNIILSSFPAVSVRMGAGLILNLCARVHVCPHACQRNARGGKELTLNSVEIRCMADRQDWVHPA